jgi:hypothetical protein
LFLVIIIHDQARVNHSRYPQKQSENEAQKETSNSTGEQNGHRRTNDAKEKSQRFHYFLPTFVMSSEVETSLAIGPAVEKAQIVRDGKPGLALRDCVTASTALGMTGTGTFVT